MPESNDFYKSLAVVLLILLVSVLVVFVILLISVLIVLFVLLISVLIVLIVLIVLLILIVLHFNLRSPPTGIFRNRKSAGYGLPKASSITSISATHTYRHSKKAIHRFG